MAIGFLPTEEDTAARYERLNRILLELYDVLFHLLHRNPASGDSSRPGEESQLNNNNSENQQDFNNIRERASSDSAAPRLPDLLCDAPPPRRAYVPRSTPTSPSCSAQHLCRQFSDLYDRRLQDSPNPVDDEVFFASPPFQSPRIPLAPPPRQRRRRKRSNSLKEKKCNKVKSEDMVDAGCWEDDKRTKIQELQQRLAVNADQDTVDSPQSLDSEKVNDSDTSLISSLLSSSLGGPLWTAVILVVGWKLLANKR